MPTSLLPISRRRFLQSSVVAAAAGWVTLRTVHAADEASDPNYYVFMADTHIDRDPDRVRHMANRHVNMRANLDKAVADILSNKPYPAGAIINGDCAHDVGLEGDYQVLARCIAPLLEAGIAVHMTMGNHDDRGPFYEVLANMRPEQPLVQDQHVLILDTPHAYLFLLDSLLRVNYTPGRLGEDQITWLKHALQAHQDKPVILFAHHYPQWHGAGGQHFGRNGLQDGDDLFAAVTDHEHVRAFLFGHSHRWEVGRTYRHVALINQPAVAYVFREEQPSAFLHARFEPQGMNLQLECLDTRHPWHGQRHEINLAAVST